MNPDLDRLSVSDMCGKPGTERCFIEAADGVVYVNGGPVEPSMAEGGVADALR